MNYGPLIFLAAFFALAASWFGLVLTPQMQVGHLTQTNTVPAQETYPLARMGLARQGLDVYRANGCAYCHSQQIGQTATVCNVVLAGAGTNKTALIQALLTLKTNWSEAQAAEFVAKLPQPVVESVTREEADVVLKALKVGGAKSELWVVPVGPDIARGWGKRRSVAEDFLYDYPVMLGSQRIGSELADVGSRKADVEWHLRHLYAPAVEVTGSLMPPYRFLFEKRRIERARSPDALALAGKLTPEPGYEVVPTPKATALAAYLVSLRADVPLFHTPLTVAAPPASTNEVNAPGVTGTNTPGMTGTNGPATALTNSPGTAVTNAAGGAGVKSNNASATKAPAK